ncbi:hypothetical protein PR048_026717 [Dryococelus australis]|uniref:Uncharacterized protein n=1 Tax=Dryococelus australis TaxID=614101 RepID=A0ABQ9GM55_9NEOP|nr:hypothetical protein PR048_026717 [Dryococelus australis]
MHGGIKTKNGCELVNILINNLPFEAFVPSYKYCGPGIGLARRLKHGDVPVNLLEEACKEHNITYATSSNFEDRHVDDTPSLTLPCYTNLAPQRVRHRGPSLRKKREVIGLHVEQQISPPRDFADSFGNKLDSIVLCAFEYKLAVHWLLLQLNPRPCSTGFGSYFPYRLVPERRDGPAREQVPTGGQSINRAGLRPLVLRPIRAAVIPGKPAPSGLAAVNKLFVRAAARRGVSAAPAFGSTPVTSLRPLWLLLRGRHTPSAVQPQPLYFIRCISVYTLHSIYLAAAASILHTLYLCHTLYSVRSAAAAAILHPPYLCSLLHSVCRQGTSTRSTSCCTLFAISPHPIIYLPYDDVKARFTHHRYTYAVTLPLFTSSRVSWWHILLLGWVRNKEKVEEVQESAVWMLDARIEGCDAGDGWVWVVSHLAVQFLGMALDQVGWRLYVAQAIEKFDGCV